MAGPVRPGTTLHEWAGIDGRTFADRQLQGAYLRWVHEQAGAALPEGVVVHHHPAPGGPPPPPPPAPCGAPSPPAAGPPEASGGGPAASAPRRSRRPGPRPPG